MSNLDTWLKVCRPPESALKKIGGGRLKGMTDISPQWRIKIMTETFGQVGFGWKYRVLDKYSHTDESGQCAVFVDLELFVKVDGEWSDGIFGTGGAMLLAEESKTDWETKVKTKALYLSDEAYKMATTDALSVAMKQLGVGADIYMGMFDGSKYTRPVGDEPVKPKPVAPVTQSAKINAEQKLSLQKAIVLAGMVEEGFCKQAKIAKLDDFDASRFDNAMAHLKGLAIPQGEAQ